VRDLGLHGRVTFAAVDRAALRSHYLRADAIVVPSEWPEPFGLVPIEAMACGRPVVATGTGGSGEFLVDGGNCLRFPAGDPKALSEAVLRLAGDPDLRTTLIAGGLRTASMLDTDRLADVLEEWHLAAVARFADGEPSPRPLVP
jgi:glycosyltransferase involved in cell wall biosynthesis